MYVYHKSQMSNSNSEVTLNLRPQVPEGKHKNRNKFGNNRLRRVDTHITYPSMREILKERLAGLGITDPKFLAWLWPQQTSKYHGSYTRDERYYIIRRQDIPGLPRFSLNHYLKSGCSANAITSTLPRLKKDKQTGETVFKTGQIDLDWKKKKLAQKIGNLSPSGRQKQCDTLKREYIERNGSTGWKELYTDETLLTLYSDFLQESQMKKATDKFREQQRIFEAFMANPNSFPDHYKRGVYDVAKRMKNPLWVDMVKALQRHGLHKPYKKYMFDVGGVVQTIKERGDREGWEYLTKPNAKESRANPYKLATGFVKTLDHRLFTQKGEEKYREASVLLSEREPATVQQPLPNLRQSNVDRILEPATVQQPQPVTFSNFARSNVPFLSNSWLDNLNFTTNRR